MSNHIEDPKTVEILKWFEEVSKIPRCSCNEEQIALWLIDWAKKNGFPSNRDKTGNVVIRIPASKGYESAPAVILQGHMDMVCEKTQDSDHDFSKDPIKPVYGEEWLTADKTTLGADNGIAIAMAMTAALDKESLHPPLELLFTVDEETSLTGAGALEPGFVEGKCLLNIDSEKEGVFLVGCAGGERGDHTLPLDFVPTPPGYVPVTIEVTGLSGGHSADIHLEKANALKLIGRTLNAIALERRFHLADLAGGKADNAIPRNAEAVIFIKPSELPSTRSVVSGLEKKTRDEFKNTDPSLTIRVSEGSKKTYNEVITEKDSARVLLLILAMPHGIYAMSAEIPNFVETSDNFASFQIEDHRLKIVTSQRSPIVSRLEDVGAHIASVVCLAGGTSDFHDRYPGWKANMDSALLKKASAVYKKLRGQEPIVETTHGGLECGLIDERLPGMDMISFGPTIQNPHSPGERIFIPSIGRIYEFLVKLLEDLKNF